MVVQASYSSLKTRSRTILSLCVRGNFLVEIAPTALLRYFNPVLHYLISRVNQGQKTRVTLI
jgi:hypothetical protein